MEFLQLRYFCSAAETENFSHTAKKFKVPVSGVSQTIKRLENELGVTLFMRSANKIVLTEEGKIFYGGARRAIEILDNAKAQLSSNNEGVRGKIKISVLTNRNLVMNIIEYFKKKYPEVLFTINHNLDFDPKDYDVLISDDEIVYKDFERKLFTSEDIYLAVEKNNPIVKLNNITPDVLSSNNFISTSKDTSLWRHTHRICFSKGFSPNVSIKCDDTTYLRKYIELGLGIAFVPESWRDVLTDNVALLKIGDYKRNTYMFYNLDALQSKAVKLFIDTLTNYASVQDEDLTEQKRIYYNF
ncbi:MAG: LysR family transcriptional regulator [Ruminococcaceae bacterium]|nr:LysR family transcriptional regulator [Oscillospiraceae bacterium]